MYLLVDCANEEMGKFGYAHPKVFMWLIGDAHHCKVPSNF